jgi:c-di-GMP-binding flagellar brake protein YcgR
MEASAQSIFEEAIDDKRTSIVSIADGSETRSLIAQFSHRDDEGFAFQTSLWPEFETEEAGKVAAFLFGTNGAAVQFEAEVRAVHKNDQIVSVRCTHPEEISIIQRRVHFRVPIPADSALGLTVWRIPTHWVLRDRPKPSAQLRVQMIDISLGGFCVKVLPGRVGPESIILGDRLRLEMLFQDSEAVFDSQVVYRSDPFPDGSIRMGISFQKLENSIEGRRASNLLDRVIAMMQRRAIQQTAVA